MIARTLGLRGYCTIVACCMEASEKHEFILNLTTVTRLPHSVHREAIAS